MGKVWKSLLWWMWDSNPRPKKPMVLPTTPFVKVIGGVLIRLTTFKKLADSLPKLSLITRRRWWVRRGRRGRGGRLTWIWRPYKMHGSYKLVHVKKKKTYSPANVHSDRENLHTRLLCALAKTSPVFVLFFLPDFSSVMVFRKMWTHTP